MQIINYKGVLLTEQEAPPKVGGSAFRFASGLFESVLVKDGIPQITALHFERLLKGMLQVEMSVPEYFTQQFFDEQILRTLTAQSYTPHCRVRFQVEQLQGQFHFLIETSALDASVFELNETGWKLGLIDLPLKDFTINGNLKCINLPLYTEGMEMARGKGWEDILLVQGDRIIESGTSNIFWIKNNKIFTPPLTEGCIEGTMRRYLFANLPAHLRPVEKPLLTTDLLVADELFLTNAVRRIKWVQQIGDRLYKHSMVKALYKFLFG